VSTQPFRALNKSQQTSATRRRWYGGW